MLLRATSLVAAKFSRRCGAYTAAAMALHDQDRDANAVRAGETVLPAFLKTAFHCPFCQVYAQQQWEDLVVEVVRTPTPISRAQCTNCKQRSVWMLVRRGDPPVGTMLHPRVSNAPLPHSEMPSDVKAEYDEAAATANISPRGAGALLRLALQKLMPHLGESGKALNDDIASLVKKGLDPDVQRALDALRVVGNNAVHPLELDLRDDAETVGALFGVLNFIVEERIARPKKLEALYGALPEGARKAIERRDAS